MKGASVQEFVENDTGIDEDAFFDHLQQVQEETKALRCTADALEHGEGRLAGLPVSAKDQISTSDFPTTAGSKILEDYRPVFDATVIEKVKA
ncbi:MAG: amidase family protein, partial [Candidatus Nanohaloarchaea archaeon]